MKKLVVIDLDKTFVNVDSFRAFILRHSSLLVLILATIRKCRLITRETFAKWAYSLLEEKLRDETIRERFVIDMSSYVNPSILSIVNEYDENAIKILLSASPNEYVQPLARKYNMIGIGSYWDKGKFYHCYGLNKLKILQRSYPTTQYSYELAISDCLSDRVLLQQFKEGYLYNSGKLTKIKTLISSIS